MWVSHVGYWTTLWWRSLTDICSHNQTERKLSLDIEVVSSAERKNMKKRNLPRTDPEKHHISAVE